MHILLIGEDSSNIDDPKSIRNWHSFCVFFLNRYLKKRNFEVTYLGFDRWENKINPIDPITDLKDIKDIDFVLGVRRIEMLLLNEGSAFIDLLVKKSKNRLCSYGDISMSHQTKYKESIFTVLQKDDTKNKIYQVWWCGDNQFLYPQQDDKKIQILLDHIDYSPKRKYNNNIFSIYREALFDLSKKYPINVKIIANPSVINFDINQEQEYPFRRGQNKWIDIIPEYRKTHIYCVTHKESGGLTVMETGACGASVIIPKDFINPILAKQVKSYHCEVEKNSIYNTLERAILDYDKQKNLDIVKKYTWDHTIDKIIKNML